MLRAINRAHNYSLSLIGPVHLNAVATYAYAIADPKTGEQRPCMQCAVCCCHDWPCTAQ